MRANVHGSSLAGITNLALLAPVREGLATGFEPVSWLTRLGRLLDAMHASRRNVRESELRGAVFPDAIGRFGMISHFRYALVPPPAVGSTRWHLSLNVSFDGGWEPYMRVIYRDIGPLLDALLCHCDGYPGSRSSDFDTYCRWVRSAELDAGIFYTDSAATLADQRYLAGVEALQRADAAADKAIAAHAEPDEATAWGQGLAEALGAPGKHLPLQLRTLKGLYRLTSYWSGADGDILLRFAQLVLRGFLDMMKNDAFATHPAVVALLTRHFADEWNWLRTQSEDPRRIERLAWEKEALQAAIVDEGPRATHGALVLLRVNDASAAAQHLSGLVPQCALPAAMAGQARLHVAFTMAGLRALQIHPERLDLLPPEFHQGMEPRAGALGDLRSNHPDHWRRPLRHGVDPAREDRIDLGVVHVAVMMRTIDEADAGHGLHPLLAAEVAALAQPGSGLTVLAVEATRSRSTGPDGRDHFGFVDGISQPDVVDKGEPDPRKDQVRPGELALGYGNDRGDGPYPVESDALLDRGSFLVVRKLRQRLDHLEAMLSCAAGADPGARTELLERMMGRRQSGLPLVQAGPEGRNDFDYSGDDQLQCPFASHVRRTNPRTVPRDKRSALPRILRRGMGYGPAANAAPADADRGTMFMAYCASIAEQFETVQRWVAGGNSSGVGSTQSDPLLGVPQEGDARVFRWVDGDGKVQRSALGAKAFVELQWGLYLFVPSLAALRQLADFRHAPPPRQAAPAVATSELDQWRHRLEDRDNGRDTWAWVRRQPAGVVDAPSYGRLLGSAGPVFEALSDAACTKVSVQGFGERMAASVGVNHLGMDPADGHTAIGKVVNPVVASIDEDRAFAAAVGWARAVLDGIAKASEGPFALRHPDGRLRLPVDLMNYSEAVIGGLARQWFGLPDGKHMQVGGRFPAPVAERTTRCPGHIIGPSRMIFGAHPPDAIDAEGQFHGPMVLNAVTQALADGLAPQTGELTDQLRAPLASLGSAHGPQLLEREVAGLLLGFAPTVHGNFLTVMKNWIEGGRLWALQQALAERLLAGESPLAAARAALRRPMLDTMQHEPVPPTVWRRPVDKGQPDAKAPPVVLGLASAIDDLAGDADPARRDALLFGGDYFADPDSDRWGLHACPGSKMGLGVMLALATVLLDAGTLRPTGSPVLLMLTPKVAPAPAPPP